MKKILALSIATLFLANFATALTLVSFNASFYDSFYLKNKTAEQLDMSHDDLMKGTTYLLDFIQEKNDNLNVEVMVDGKLVPMYNQREIDHMVDVVNLFHKLKIMQLSFYGFFSVILLYWIVVSRKTLLKDVLQASKLALGIIGVFMGSILIAALVDFDSFWTAFHQVLFTNDLWLLNPLTDRLIVMVPLDFFQQLVFTIVLSWLLSLSIWFGGLYLLNRRKRA